MSEPTPDEGLTGPDSADAGVRSDRALGGAPRGVDSESFVTAASGYLRIAAWVAVPATLLGSFLLPGLRGSAQESVVVGWERVSNALAYSLAAVACLLVLWGATALGRETRLSWSIRLPLIAIGAAALALGLPAFATRLHAVPALALAMVVSFASLFSGVKALREAHTRAAGAILACYGLAGLSHAAAWRAATVAGEHAEVGLYRLGRGFSTMELVFEALGFLIAGAWIATRSRLRGRLSANLAAVLAIAVVWVAARDLVSPSTVDRVLRAAVLHHLPAPTPLYLDRVLPGLAIGALFMAVAALVQESRSAIPTLVALTLLARGRSDVPLQSWLAVIAAQWLALSSIDQKTMWQGLLGKPRS